MARLYALLILLSLSVVSHAQPLKACTNEWPPYTLLEEGQVRGIDADLLHLVLTNLGISYDIILEPWRRCLHKMRNNKLDILLDTPYFDDYAKNMIYPDEYISEINMLLVYDLRRPHLRKR